MAYKTDGALSVSARWREILGLLGDFLKKSNFFQCYSFSPTQFIQECLTSAGFSWLCCDAGLLLDDIMEKGTPGIDITQQTHDTVQQWCLGMWSDLKINTGYEYGIFDPREIILKKSHLHKPFAFHIHTLLIRFLRDLNLSFSRNLLDRYDHDIAAQRNAFFRFSRSMEDALEISRQETAVDQLDQAFSVMGVREKG